MKIFSMASAIMVVMVLGALVCPVNSMAALSFSDDLSLSLAINETDNVASWTHTIDPSDFDMPVDDLSSHGIAEAYLDITLDVTTPNVPLTSVVLGDGMVLDWFQICCQQGTATLVFNLNDYLTLLDDWELNVTVSNFPNGASADITQAVLRGSAVPIPAAALLFGSGLVGLIGFRRRQSTKRGAN